LAWYRLVLSIKFRHLNGDPNLKNYIFEAKGAGAAFLDFDNDGWMDLLLVQGLTATLIS
jgi:hypothetical protein